MNTFTKTLVGGVAAGTMAVATATPALARDRDGGIDAGEVIAGALVLGGIAAVVASAGNNNDRYSYNRGYDRRGSGYGSNNPRVAVQQCVQAAERNAARYSYGRANVTDVRSVRNKRNGYDVKGRIAVNTRGREWRSGDPRYGRGWNGDYRGWNSRMSGYDSGNFTCKVRYGRITDLDYSGIRGLR